MTKKHPPIKHIWFDFAGTLYKETPDFKIALRAHGYKVYAALTGKSDREQVKKEFDDLYARQGSNSAVFRSLGQPDNYWQKAAARFNRESFFTSEREVLQTLDKLRKIVPISLFTNFERSNIYALCKHLKIPKTYFTYIVAGDDVQTRKPALDGFYMMIEKSKLPPEQLLYVGDREAVDIEPAKKVGMQACMLYGSSKAADYTFTSFKDILTLLRSGGKTEGML